MNAIVLLTDSFLCKQEESNQIASNTKVLQPPNSDTPFRLSGVKDTPRRKLKFSKRNISINHCIDVKLNLIRENKLHDYHFQKETDEIPA